MNQLVSIFKLLSDETRLRMLILLYQEELCVCEISGILDIPQPRISQNLSKMRDLDLVEDERREKYMYYSLKKDNLILLDILGKIYSDIGSYPKLLKDQKGLKTKDIYLTSCGVSC